MSKINKKDIELLSSQTSGKHLAHVFSRFLIFRNMMTIEIGNFKVKINNNDFSRINSLNKKWILGNIYGKQIIYRIENSPLGKYPVLLAQDITGRLCRVEYIDGNTMNNRFKNIRKINPETSFIYDMCNSSENIKTDRFDTKQHSNFMNLVFESKNE